MVKGVKLLSRDGDGANGEPRLIPLAPVRSLAVALPLVQLCSQTDLVPDGAEVNLIQTGQLAQVSY